MKLVFLQVALVLAIGSSAQTVTKNTTQIYAVDGCPTLSHTAGTTAASMTNNGLYDGKHQYVGRAAMKVSDTTPKLTPTKTDPHVYQTKPCGVAGLNAAQSPQPLEIRVNRVGYTFSHELVNAFSLLRKREVSYASFTLEIIDSKNKVVTKPEAIVIGSHAISKGGRRLQASNDNTEKHDSQKEQKMGENDLYPEPNNEENTHAAEAEPSTQPGRRLLKGSWGARSTGSSWRRRYNAGRRRYSSRRRYGYVQARRRTYVLLFNSGQPVYYGGGGYRNHGTAGYPGNVGMVQGRLDDDYAPGTYNSYPYGYSGVSKKYTATTTSAPGLFAQSYKSSECVNSCSTSNNCVGKSACVCTSCQAENKVFMTNNPSGYYQDVLMKTGFIPNNVQWPLKLKITNLVYEKQDATGTVYSTSSTPSQDLFFFFSEVDSGIAAPSSVGKTSPCILIALVVGVMGWFFSCH